MSERWERREEKRRAKRERMAKHGRSIMTAIETAEVNRARRPRSGAKRKPRRR